MINTKTYEDIKNELVNAILIEYEDFKRELKSFEDKIERGHHLYILSGTNKPISERSSAKRSAMYSNEKLTEEENLKRRLGNLNERFSYIYQYRKTFNRVVEHRKKLNENISELKSFNKITKDKFSEKNDATSIFEPIKAYAINSFSDSVFRSIESVKGHIENYLENNYELDLFEIATEENGVYNIKDDIIRQKEKVFFETIMESIRHDIRQVKEIEKAKDSKNYLKYYLLFK